MDIGTPWSDGPRPPHPSAVHPITRGASWRARGVWVAFADGQLVALVVDQPENVAERYVPGKRHTMPELPHRFPGRNRRIRSSPAPRTSPPSACTGSVAAGPVPPREACACRVVLQRAYVLKRTCALPTASGPALRWSWKSVAALRALVRSRLSVPRRPQGRKDSTWVAPDVYCSGPTH